MSELLERLQTTLGDGYRIERELGGGMSRVFVARELALGRMVVIKVLPPEMAAGVNVERFRREIQLAASLQHPHIVPLLTAGSSGDLLYYVMPLVEGESLRGRLVRGGELPIAQVVRVMRDVASALAYAHSRGTVHRDIKPDNILFAGEYALVTDFGVAKAVSEATGESALTSLGIALGTPSYMAPEQAAADPHADSRVDIYALGCVGYEMLTGRPPFIAPNPQMVLAAHVTQTPDPVTQHRTSVPSTLALVVMRCLEKKPADRWQTADDLCQQLTAMATPSAGHEPTTAVASTTVGAMPSASHAHSAWRSRRTAIASAFVLGVAAFTTLAFLMSRGRGARYDPKRVMVAEFDNQTRDPAYDPLGRMAADWITQGIAQAGVAEVQSARLSARAGRDLRGDAPSPDERIVRTEPQGLRPGTIVRGSYYRDGDSLRFQAEIVDAAADKVARAIDPVAAPLGNPMAAIEKLRQRILGALATLNTAELADWARATTQPPTFEAYQEYLAGLEARDPRTGAQSPGSAQSHFLRAFQLDSTFVLAALAAIGSVPQSRTYEPSQSTADSLIAALERMRPRMSPVDRALLDNAEARRRYDWLAELGAARQIAALAPGPSSYLGVASAAIRAGRPYEALAALKRADPQERLVEGWGDRTDALHLAGDFKTELRATVKERELGIEDVYDQVQIFATLGDVEQVNDHIDERVRRPPRRSDTPAQLMWFAAREYRAHGRTAESQAVIERAIVWIQSLAPDETTDYDRETLARALYHAGRWAEARDAYRTLARTDTTTGPTTAGTGTVLRPVRLVASPRSIEFLGGIGRSAAHLGDRAEAERVFTELGRLPRQQAIGFNHYEQAQIAAALGRKDQAVALVQQAWAAGVPYAMYFHREIDWEALRDYPPFARLLHPKN